MKKLSIKLRVTLWFTLLMLLLVGVVLLVLFYVGSRIVTDNSKDTLVKAVAESLEEIDFDDGRLEIDDDLDYFQEGAYLSVYDHAGNLLYGRLPSAFEGTVDFVDNQLATVQIGSTQWYVYDVQYAPEGYGSTVWVRGIMSADGSGNTIQLMIRLAAVLLPFLVVLAAIGGYLLIHRAFRPVRQITRAAESIGESKDLTKRINLGQGKDEIYTLAETFDRMFDRLQSAFERERQFTSDASHELRTPVAVIIAQCEYALANAQTVEEEKEALETVLAQAQRMSALIAQLLTLSRADRGQSKLQMEPIDLSELVEIVADQVQEAAAKRQITVETEIEPHVLLHGDETMLMRMLLNLMENGVKYGREGGYLSVKLHRHGSDVVGEIADDGIGIAEQHLEKIWERFYQVNPARSSSEEGVGLGLPMVRYIAEAHGGHVTVSSVLGQGSRFVFTLPLS